MVLGSRRLGLAVASLVLVISAGAACDELGDDITQQRPVALEAVLDNIGPDGSQVPGTAAGLVVASPSRNDPDYFFTWSRDAALTFKMIVEEYIRDPSGRSHLEGHIRNYIRSQAILQTVANPSGTLLPSGRGLGEVKYHVDGSRFNGAWGRPQHDGPSLRAIAVIGFAKWLAEQGPEGEAEARDVIWPVIANDLSYTGQYWNTTGFDLWEEVHGASFFTVQSQYRALVEGAQLADRLGVSCGPACDEAPEVACFLNAAFWNGQYFVSNIHNSHARSGRDANSMLGSNVVFDVNAPCDSPSIQPCASRALASFKQWVDGFRDGNAYPINSGIPPNRGVAVGRYTEDVYLGGHPWYLITYGAAEFLYNAVAQWKRQGSLTIDSTSRAFFADLYSRAPEGTYRADDSVFSLVVDAVTAYADSFVEVARRYTPEDGALAEQFDRRPPFQPVGARDLTWSYAALITMAASRAGEYAASWVPADESAPSAPCPRPEPPHGTYFPAIAAGAPNNTDSLCAVPVEFRVLARTYYGEDIYVFGSASSLGDWDINNAQPLSTNEYSDSHPLWNAVVDVDAPGERLAYKYVRRQNCNQGYVYEWVDRYLDLPPCGTTDVLVVNEQWNGPTGQPGNC
ncbi:glucoamylase P [Sodiomyces alkalinus F11]|uniref:Glucoamylase n=1 Tax=Sodiomyces alkalinus (strain CBS 110278 / VKM F-3762 / F11) TaxID=1314773 RepID=A0A3N2PW70_SODAK|nr:glucoamylase P [Sodiomyces alkalinus F11]ROT38732.1 glucoamylase P [Sodiomyces alkalinus F11]